MTSGRPQKEAAAKLERGPALGEHFPAVELADQHGRLIDLHAVRNNRPALVAFDRSTLW
jgi:hypothetical protein